MKTEYEIIHPNTFEQESHFYPKALNSELHPIVSHFFNLDFDQIIKRYLHLNPQIDKSALIKILSYQSKHFFWGGADLFCVTTETGERRLVVLETNSCPSGQKSMPPRNDSDEHRGYRFLIEQSFLPILKKKRLPPGALAVIYDKNYRECSGYAATLADLTQEEVYLIPHYDQSPSHISFNNGLMNMKKRDGTSVAIRAALRYVTQKPWNRIPISTKTFIYNSTLVCLAGGRNKLLANKAYELFNSEISHTGLSIKCPETIKDVNKLEIPLWIQKFGGRAVVKVPYSNAGQGVYTITNEEELEKFMNHSFVYDQFIVQSLIGHYYWSSIGQEGRYFHVGTIPNKRQNIYVADLRVMIYNSSTGFVPCALYARKARKPLEPELTESSWNVLGTNLSIKTGENTWESDTSRLMLMDRKDFNSLGIGMDDLIEAYIQTVLSVIAIDKMSQNLLTKKGLFKRKLFQSLDNDSSLLQEIM